MIHFPDYYESDPLYARSDLILIMFWVAIIIPFY